MRKKTFFAAALIASMVPSIAFAQSLKDAETALTVGNWKVLRTIDPMDDSVRCTGIYNNDYSVQLSKDTLFLGVQGGVQGITLRFDDNPPNRLRLATDMEKKLRSVIISGRDFSQLTTSSRLRYQVSTLVRGIESGDLDLDGLTAAIGSISRSCPSETSSSGVSPPAAAPSTCAPAMTAKMREQGLTEEQVDAICAQ
jgi:hypothetical protein